MRIQSFEHAPNGSMDEVVRLHLFDVMFLDLGQYFRKNFEFFVGLTGIARFFDTLANHQPQDECPDYHQP